MPDESVWLPEYALPESRTYPTETGRIWVQVNTTALNAGEDDLRHPSFSAPELSPVIPAALKADQAIPLVKSLRLRLGLLAGTLMDRFSAAIGRERDLGSIFNFVPVALALGIIAYYAAPVEPHRWMLALSLVIPGVLALKGQSRGVIWHFCVGAGLFFAGMALAQSQVQRNAMPVPLSDLTGMVSGRIVAIDENRSGSPRYLIRPHTVAGLEAEELPRHVRLSARNGPDFILGDTIEGLARMSPLNGPAYPGGYDFAFAARMDGLGMSGFFMGAPTKAQAVPDEAILLTGAVKTVTQSVRQAIANRIRAGLPGEPGDIAVALVTGDRSGLSEQTQESLRRSGLAHILAISGLHMALVTLTVIWLVRAGLILIPGFVNRHPIRKYAVIAGFLTATAYLMISGMGVATVRAWLMITVMLAASLLDRRAITMRSVSIAALIILALFPASLFNPGFQMSFAAVAALVAVYGEWSRYRLNHHARREFRESSPVLNGAKGLAGWFGGLSTTSLVAGTATALFALWHFHRVAPMGLFANLLAMPIVSIAVMPLALLAMFLMPYGFETLALRPLGMAVEAVLAVSDYINSFGLDFETGLQPFSVLAGATLFLVLACCLRTRLRWLALLPLAVLLAGLLQRPSLPDLLIAQDGRAIAVKTSLLRNEDGGAVHDDSLTLLYPDRSKFITDIWQRALLPNREFSKHPVQQGCDQNGCAFSLSAMLRNYRVHLIYDPDQIAAACAAADILLAPRLWWVQCRSEARPQLILKRGDFEARGSHVLRIGTEGIAVETAWNNPVSAFEAAEGARTAYSVPPPRPWLERFDNISRRFDGSEN